MPKSNFRIESDSMGKMKVPKNALYAAQTARAIKNFPISGLTFKRPFIEALGVIKFSAAKVNQELKLISPNVAKAVMKASDEVIKGVHDSEFVVACTMKTIGKVGFEHLSYSVFYNFVEHP